MVSEILKQCRADYVGLWWIIALIRKEHVPEPDVRGKVLSLLQEVLTHAEIVAGQFRDRRFEPWDMTAKDAVAKVNREWTALGREPSLGDIVWLTHRDYAATHKPV